MKKKSVVFAFLSINGTAHKQRCFINSVVCRFTGSDLIHVELYFPETERSFSISAHSDARFKVPQYKMDEWEFVPMDLSEKEYDKVMKICQKRVGTPFDMAGMLSVSLGRLAKHIGAAEQSFCSKLVSAVMVASGVFPQDFDVFTATPKSLRDFVVGRTRCHPGPAPCVGP